MPHMKLKNNKIKTGKKIKYILIFFLTYFVFGYTFYNSFKNNSEVINEKYINYLLSNGNAFNENGYKIPKIINKTINFILRIDFSKPTSIFNGSILGYDYQEEDENQDLEKLKAISSYISDPNKVDINNPLIYIYNSHQLENYNNDGLSIYGITPNVLMASYLLKEKLNEKGLSTIVEDTNITEFLELNKWDYSYSYKASRIFILDKKNTYNSLKYYIDIHRDSVHKDLTSVKINNKVYARILFVIGLEHKNYGANLKFAQELNALFEKKYAGLSRGILKKEGPNVNGIYNQDISDKAILIEVGGVDNNIDEVINTINAISDVLDIYIGEHEK